MPNESRKKIGVLTSGGDAPGMNAAIRAVVRTAVYNDCKVIGFLRGYEGLLSADIMELKPRSVSDIIHRGGTILRTARCMEMMSEAGQEKGAQVCRVLGLDALVVIGGDGSFRGGQALSKKGVNVMGIPATIDMDLACTDYTIGFDTAVNTGMEAVNKIRDTSSSHERCSVVEVMGRNCGHIAMWCAITAGAEEVVFPEIASVSGLDMDGLIRQVIENRAKGKTHNLIIVAEGVGGSAKLATEIEKVTGIETRATILGYLQRGGTPSANDRMHGSLMGYEAVTQIMEGKENQVVVFRNGKHTCIGLEEAVDAKRPYDNKLYKVMKILSI